MSSNGSFTDGITNLVQKARKSWYALRSKIHLKLWNNPAVVLKLFDAIVKPILIYTSEVWCQQLTKQISNTDIQKCDSLKFEKNSDYNLYTDTRCVEI